jgi:deoxyribonuclease-4
MAAITWAAVVRDGMLQVGAHVSIGDGFDAAVAEQRTLGGTVGQVFVGSPRTWRVKDVDEDHRAAFQDALADAGDVGPWIAHGTYLINFATPDEDLAAKSIDTVQGELDACATLGIPYYVFHPGAHTGAGTETGVDNVADRLSELDIPEETTLLLENTAGKGTTVGTTMEQLDRMVQESDYDYGAVQVCLDSCHLFAAGYDFRTADGMDELVSEVDDVVGVDNVAYLHLNDSRHPLGSEKDEHAHVGEGDIGEAGFEQFVNHDAFRDRPMVLETPVDDDRGYAWNIEKIRELYDG